MSKTKIPGKWIAGLDPGMPLIEAARLVLGIRLKAVATLLPLAAELTDESDDRVHQLRIATRRAAAALSVFKPCLKRSLRRKMRRRLSRIRRAAAESRRCDVHRRLLQQARHNADDSLNTVLDQLDSEIGQERIQAMQMIANVAGRYHAGKFRRATRRLVRSAKVRGPNDRSAALRDAAAIALPDMAASLLEAGQEDLQVIENVHWLRIRAKRLRYAMEVLAPCLGAEVRDELYPLMQELQEYLGPINDCHEIVVRLERRIEDLRDPELRSAEAGDADSPGKDEPTEELLAGLSRLAGQFRDDREMHRRRFVEFWQTLCDGSFFEAIERAARSIAAPVQSDASASGPPAAPPSPPPNGLVESSLTRAAEIEILTRPVAVPARDGGAAGTKP